MADYLGPIKPKKSSTTGEVPSAADLEVAELAVNTADGKIWTKHSDGSVKELGKAQTVNGQTGDVNLGIDDLSDVDSSSTAPTQGQALVWNDSDQHWEPGTITGFSGSYNDLTDKPSSRIQDQADFQLTQTANEIVFPNRVNNYLAIATENDWSADVWGGSGGGFVVSWLAAAGGGGDLATQAELIGVGDTVTLTWPDASVSTETVAALYPLGNRKGFVINNPNTSNWSGHPTGSALRIASSSLTAGAEVPLADDDILQWDNAEQKFKPAQLASVASTGSYNDLTDKPAQGSSRIQDSTDFQLNSASVTVYDFPSYSGSPAGIEGSWGVSGTRTYFRDTDANGLDFQAALLALPETGSWWWSYDNSTWNSDTYTARGDFDGTRCFLVDTNGPGASRLYVAFQDPTHPPSVPLTDDDYIKWSSNKFRPARLSTVANSGSYNDLVDRPSIPGSLGDLSDVSTAAPTGGQVLSWDQTSSQWLPASVTSSGVSTGTIVNSVNTMSGDVVLATSDIENDSGYITSSQAPVQPDDIPSRISELDFEGLLSDGQLLQFDETIRKWRAVSMFNVRRRAVISDGDLTDSPMVGPVDAYADSAAMLADGWNEISGFAGQDDRAVAFSFPNDEDSVLDGALFVHGHSPTYDHSSARWFLNTNGGIGWDVSGTTTAARSGSYRTDSNNIDCYVCLDSSDLRGKLAGWKTLQVDGENIGIVFRIEFFDPYNNTAQWWCSEVEFHSTSAVKIRYGRSNAPGLIPSTPATGSTRAGLASNGSNPIGIVLNGFPSLSSTGEYSVSYTLADLGESLLGIRLVDMADVAVASPSNGDVISWNASSERWIFDSTTYMSRSSLKQLVAASTDFADFKTRIAAL